MFDLATIEPDPVNSCLIWHWFVWLVICLTFVSPLTDVAHSKSKWLDLFLLLNLASPVCGTRRSKLCVKKINGGLEHKDIQWCASTLDDVKVAMIAKMPSWMTGEGDNISGEILLDMICIQCVFVCANSALMVYLWHQSSFSSKGLMTGDCSDALSRAFVSWTSKDCWDILLVRKDLCGVGVIFSCCMKKKEVKGHVDIGSYVPKIPSRSKGANLPSLMWPSIRT